MRRLALWLMVIVLSLTIFPIQAQQPPDPINAALADLSKQVGHPVALSDLDSWTFEQKTFPDPSLGCPKPGVMYAQVVTGGFQFILTYQGTAYDYRVSNDRQIVVLCGSNVATPVPVVCPPPGDVGFLPPRLAKGVQAHVVAGGIPNNIRDQPGSSGKLLGEIPPGQAFTVLDGPRCSLLDKIVWWQVTYNGINGWTGEGQNGEYWVEPLNASGTPVAPAPNQPITSANAAQVVGISGAGSGVVAVSPNGDKLAQAARDTDASPVASVVTVSFPGTEQVVLTLGRQQSLPEVTAIAFDSTANRVVVGYKDGTVRLFDLPANPSTSPLPTLQFSAHTSAVTSLAFSADGQIIISGGEDALVRLWDAGTGANLANLSGHTDPIVSAYLSADSTTLISKDNKNQVKFWRVQPGATG